MVESNPTNPEAELDLVRFLYASKGPAAARKELDRRINAGGEVFPYQIALADFDFSQGNFTDAEQRIQNLVGHASSTTNRFLPRRSNLRKWILRGAKLMPLKQSSLKFYVRTAEIRML